MRRLLLVALLVLSASALVFLASNSGRSTGNETETKDTHANQATQPSSPVALEGNWSAAERSTIGRAAELLAATLAAEAPNDPRLATLKACKIAPLKKSDFEEHAGVSQAPNAVSEGRDQIRLSHKVASVRGNELGPTIIILHELGHLVHGDGRKAGFDALGPCEVRAHEEEAKGILLLGNYFQNNAAARSRFPHFQEELDFFRAQAEIRSATYEVRLAIWQVYKKWVSDGEKIEATLDSETRENRLTALNGLLGGFKDDYCLDKADWLAEFVSELTVRPCGIPKEEIEAFTRNVMPKLKELRAKLAAHPEI